MKDVPDWYRGAFGSRPTVSTALYSLSSWKFELGFQNGDFGAHCLGQSFQGQGDCGGDTFWYLSFLHL